MPAEFVAPALVGFAVSLALTLALVPIARRAGLRLQFVDKPGSPIKIHRVTTPRTGGVAIVVAFAAALGVALLMEPGFGVPWPIAAGAAALVLLGLADDRWALDARLRLAIQFVALGAVVALGFDLDLTGYVWVDRVIVVLWMVGVTNALNLVDVLDGLAASIALTASVGFALLGAIVGAPGAVVVAALLAGASLGFLRYNLVHARIFMGEVGSTFLGITLAALAISVARQIDAGTLSRAAPALIVEVPVFEVAFLSYVRIRKGLSPLRGSRDHLAHKLLDRGRSPLSIVGYACGATVLLSILAVGSALAGWWAPVISASLLVAAGLVVLHILGTDHDKQPTIRI